MKNVFVLATFFLFMAACTNDDEPEPIPVDNNNLPTEFKALYGLFEGTGIGAAVNISDEIMLFFSTDGQQYAWFEDLEIKKVERIDKPDGLFDGLAFSTIGAAIDYKEERLIFFNKVGGTYQWANINPDNIAGNSAVDTLIEFEGVTFGLFEWGVDNSCPFDEIGAIFGFTKEPSGCQMVEDDDLYLWMASDDGDQVTRYLKEDVEFDSTTDLELWRSQNYCGGFPAIFPLATIGAACVYDPAAGVYRELYFNKEGSQLVILTPSTGAFSEVYNLF